MLYAMIDVGSNTIRMAVYEIDGDRIEMIMKRKNNVGLASYVRDGIMRREGIEKVVEIINGYNEFLNDFGIYKVTAFTTAAIRNAINGKQVVDEIASFRKRIVSIVADEKKPEKICRLNFQFFPLTEKIETDSEKDLG